ncbi:MAG: c-type cytochrome domain-containing protein [Pirellulales bacterium]
MTDVRAEEKLTFDDHLAPIFRQRCASCHNPTARKADLDVTNYLSLMQGGASGTVIESGDAASSYLFTLVAHDAEPYMPQNADKIPDAEIDLLRRWIDGGALENAGSKAVKPKAKMSVAAVLDPGKRPEVVPMPPRLVLEPFYRTEHAPMARSLATSPWAPLLAVTSQRQVLLYNTATLDLVSVFPFPEGQPNVVRFSRDGRLLLAGGGRPAASGKVVVWDITTGERIIEIGNELDVVLAADISADYKQIALGGPQRIVRVYSTETGELLYERAKHTDWVLAVEFSPDGVLLATADRNGGLCVWETHSGNEYLTLNGHTAAVTALSWRGDSNLLASASEDATVRLWELENGTQVKNWNAKTALLSLEFARDGRIVTCGRDQITRLWDQDGKQLMETSPIGEIAVSVTFCDESLRAVAASWAGAVQVYKADDASALGNLATNPPTIEERLAIAQQRLKQKTELSTPLLEAVRKAEAELLSVQTALSTGRQEAEALRAEVKRLTSEISQIGESRAASDGERAKISTTIAQVQDAHPLVAEALRHLTEALGKQPDDAKLVEVQRQLTEHLQTMETQAADLQTKLAELAAAVTAADDTLKETSAQLEAVNKSASVAEERVKAIETESQQLTTALESARQAAQPAEAELAQAQQDAARWQDEIAFRDQMAALKNELEAARKLADERQMEVDKATEQLAAAQAVVDSAKANRDEASRTVDAVSIKVQAARNPK